MPLSISNQDPNPLASAETASRLDQMEAGTTSASTHSGRTPLREPNAVCSACHTIAAALVSALFVGSGTTMTAGFFAYTFTHKHEDITKQMLFYGLAGIFGSMCLLPPLLYTQRFTEAR